MTLTIIMWIKQVWHCTQHRHQMEALGSFVPLEKECLKQAAPNKGEVSRGQRCRWNWAEKDFYSRLQESFHPWENMIQAMMPRSQRAQDRNMLRELLGKLGLAREQQFLVHLIFHELQTRFHTCTHWKTFHLENTCSSLSDHSSWWIFLLLGKVFFIWNTYKVLKLKPGKIYWTKSSWQDSEWPPHKKINAKLKLNKQQTKYIAMPWVFYYSTPDAFCFQLSYPI